MAVAYLEAGLSPIPCGGDDGKKPCVAWSKFAQNPASVPDIQNWMRRFSNANVGSVTGPVSNLTVVDLDAIELLDTAIRRFGQPAILASTPRGGRHLFYRYNGEKSAQGIDGLKIDIRAQGGFIVLPPSIRSIDLPPYKLERGCFDRSFLSALSPIKAGALPSTKPAAAPPSEAANIALLVPANDLQPQSATTGFRNTRLFKTLIGFAISNVRSGIENSASNLQVFANEYNLSFENPLPPQEVERTAKSVWRYCLTNRLYSSGKKQIVVSDDVYLMLEPDALKVYMLLLRNCRQSEVVKISAKSLAAFLEWGTRRVRNARSELETTGLILRLGSGGKKIGDCATFRLNRSL